MLPNVLYSTYSLTYYTLRAPLRTFLRIPQRSIAYVLPYVLYSTYSLTYYTVRAVCSYMARNVHPYAHVTYVLHYTLRVFIHGT